MNYRSDTGNFPVHLKIYPTLRIVFRILCFVLFPVLIFSQGKKDIEEVFDRYFESIDQFSGNVLVAKKGQVLYSKSFGYANLELGVRNEKGTKFRIGSLTKQFTAMGIMILVEQGKISLHQSIASYLDSIPAHWEPITVHQLLSHTSGLIHAWESSEFKKCTSLELTTEEVIALFEEVPLRTAPGKSFHYSGLGYFILARIIEKASGLSYAAFMVDFIFEPLSMENTGMDDPRGLIPGRASGYLLEDKEIKNAGYLNLQLLKGGGNIYSTVHDLLLWDRALYERRLISEKGDSTLFQPVQKKYAYGWRVLDTPHGRLTKHNGAINGFFAQIFRLTDEQVLVIVLMNQTRPEHPRLGNQFFQIVKQHLLNEKNKH